MVLSPHKETEYNIKSTGAVDPEGQQGSIVGGAVDPEGQQVSIVGGANY